ncbi:hypothetical protein CPLU01_13597 [Colletotrichum plurivorum]|uniref:Protein kinase domain-containing protein n=1 Tax=Colletotrichum plurivorum TaxID=2175906 RepID=A0A8H6N2R6_9PEZI|nr:hypothetical protein CPLU01_13597 [Colletotrichum plurivorum]
MRAPYFTGRPPSSDDLWRLDEEVSLPWTEVSDIEVHQDDEIPIDLNFSTVHKIRIHEDHHNLDGSEDGFALKILDPITLPESAEDSFKNERTSRILHPHITALLTAFEHRTKFHLLLPFAEGPGQTFPTTKAIGCLTYRPPEADIKDSETDHSWDIWCLGCVFLELVTWVIQGESGVKAFGDKRLSEEKGRDQEDTFFRGKPRGILKCFFTTKIKQSVTSHIRDLRTNQECTEELRAFLRCIEENMLVVKSNQRATSPQVRDSLKDLVDQLAGTTGTHQQQHHQSEIAPLLGGQSETTGSGVGKYT